MNLRREYTKLDVSTSATLNGRRVSNVWRGQHATSNSVGDFDYCYNPNSVTTQRAQLASTSRAPNGAPEWCRYQPLPPLPHSAQRQLVSTSRLSDPRSTVLLLGRSAFAEPETDNHEGVLQRKAHIRRRHRKSASECQMKIVTAIGVPAVPAVPVPASPASLDSWDEGEAVTPLIESVARMYADLPSREDSWTSSSPVLEAILDSPSVYSMYIDDEELHEHEDSPIYSPFVDRGVAALALQNWANGVHDRHITMEEVPEGRLLPKRVETIHLKALLRRRREEAGLPDETLNSPDDY